MLKDFQKDLEAARSAERLVLELLQSKCPRFIFKDVSDNISCRYKGDIEATSKELGIELYIEVKCDSRIADTGRILCEEQVFIKDLNDFQKGNMYCKSDFYCVVSKSERLVYIFDFQKLKENYKKYGEFKIIEHYDQDTYCYLLDLCWCKSKGALLYKLSY